ncbi:MAG: amino acid permease [Candidatus Korarchaeum sp.]
MGEAPTIFVRRSSGLIREVYPKDSFIYNVYFTAYFTALVFVYLIALYVVPAQALVPGLMLSTALFAFQVLVYALMSTAMPRSGGDYVIISRALHPLLGFISSWNWFIWLAFWFAFGGYTFSCVALSTMLMTLGLVTNNASLVSLGEELANPIPSLIVGTLIMVTFLLLTSFGLRRFLKVQLVTFVVGVVGVLIGLIYLASCDPAAYASTLNKLMSQYTGIPDTYNAIIDAAKGLGWGTERVYGFTIEHLIKVLPAAYLAVPWTMGTVFIAGEVAQVRRAQLIGGVGGLAFIGGLTVLIAFLLQKAMGIEFLSAFSYLFYNPPENLNIPIQPYFNTLAFLIIENPLLNLWANLGFIFLGWMYMAQNLLNDSRLLFAWSFDRLIPEKFAEVSERFKSPIYALLTVFIIAEIFLFAIIFVPELQVISSIMALSFSVIIMSLAAIFFPYLRREMFERCEVNWRVFGVPVITILGALSLTVNLIANYYWITDPNYGAVNDISVAAMLTVILVGIVIYSIGIYRMKRKGIDVSKVYTQLPPV